MLDPNHKLMLQFPPNPLFSLHLSPGAGRKLPKASALSPLDRCPAAVAVSAKQLKVKLLPRVLVRARWPMLCRSTYASFLRNVLVTGALQLP